MVFDTPFLTTPVGVALRCKCATWSHWNKTVGDANRRGTRFKSHSREEKGVTGFERNLTPTSMARPSSSSSIISFLRQSPNLVIRNRSLVTGNHYGDVEGAHQHKQKQQDLEEIVKRVSEITRTRPRWERTLLSDFRSFNFLDPSFLSHFVKHQNNAFISLRFFHWLSSQSGFLPDSSSCNVLFDALVAADACNAAKSFLESTNFNPNPDSIQAYIRCLCKGGLLEEAIIEFGQLKEVGVCASTKTWNSALKASIRAGRTDFVWELYGEMMNSKVEANFDTVECVVQAYCDENRVSECYKLLKDAIVPRNAAFNRLISRLCKNKDFGRMSDALHTMIGRKQAPDLFTYQEVVNGLCKAGKGHEGFRVFKDLKDRGYAPDRVMYTTMIHGLCEMRCLGDARKLWFEMIRKGFLPNEYTYNSMIHGYFRIGNLQEAWKMYREMCDKGYGEKTVSYNVMIKGLCSHGRIKEAHDLFEEMSRKGVPCNHFTYNTLVIGFCKEGKILEGRNLLYELLDRGIQPSAASYASLIEKICEEGNMENAKILWDDMQKRGLKPAVHTHDFMITGFCKQGCAIEGMEWLATMLSSKWRPGEKTFESLIQCLLQIDRLDYALLVLDSMLNIGYRLRISACNSLVAKLCEKNPHPVETYLERILERN